MHRALKIAAVTTRRGYGPEMAVNGGFDADTNWNKGANWTISGGVLVATNVTSGASCTNTGVALIVGRRYRATFTITVSAGAVSLNPGQTGTSRSASGTYTEYIVAVGTALTVQQRGASFTGTVDNVSVQEFFG